MIAAIIQARMGSSRLPGKIMMDLCGTPVLGHIVERLKGSEKIDKIIVATGNGEENDEVREFCGKNGILCFSGSENDVLDRFFKAAKMAGAKSEDTIIRITADCPLIDFDVLDRMLDRFFVEGVDYMSNSAEPTFPDGLDCEAFYFKTLEEAWKNAKLASEREHVTLYIRNHPEKFSVSVFKNSEDLSYLRWTLDEQEDYELIKQIYEKLYFEKPMFLLGDVLNLLKDEPELTKINSKFMRNEGLEKSLKNDFVVGINDEEA